MPDHRVAAVANEFLDRAQREGISLTNMQLQKLPYIAYGWNLALRHERLISCSPQAWKYGPVYPELYEKLKRYGATQVTGFIHENDDNPFADRRGEVIREPFTPGETELLNTVWDAYKQYNGFALSVMTHRQGTPWTKTFRDGAGNGETIPDTLIQQHYVELANATPG